MLHRDKYSFHDLLSDAKTAVFLKGILLFLTPVLKSLTVTYHDNTIMMLVIVFIIIHLMLYDYQSVKKPVNFENITKGVGSPTSLNAIFFAAILLSSRLGKLQ